MWTAITINQKAMAKNLEGNSYKKQPLSLPIIVDVRKFADSQSKINWINMNCLSVINQSVNPNDDTKLSDVFNLFKNDLNNNIKDKVFYWIKNGDLKGEPFIFKSKGQFLIVSYKKHLKFRKIWCLIIKMELDLMYSHFPK